MSNQFFKTAREQRAHLLVQEILHKLAAPRRGHDGPKLPERPEAPSIDTVDPPKPPKAPAKPRPTRQNTQTQSGATQGTLRVPQRKI